MTQKQTMTERRIKSWLVRHLRETGEAKGAKVLCELCVADFSRRADVVLANGTLTAFEIKGELDTLDRLPGQVDTFSRYFEGLTVVCAPKHTAKVFDMVPEAIGIWEVDGDQMVVKRAADVSRQQDRNVWLSYLPVRILKNLLKQNTIRPCGQRRDQLIEAASAISVDAIRNAALVYLKSRGTSPSETRVRQSPAPQISNPVRVADLRVREFVAMLKSAPEHKAAIPRKVGQAA